MITKLTIYVKPVDHKSLRANEGIEEQNSLSSPKTALGFFQKFLGEKVVSYMLSPELA
jgi:hypothetical protein